MIRIAVTGGIGSGKSIVSKLLKIFSYPVYDADSEAKRLMASSATIRNKLVALLGQSVYKNGILDKNYLASIIFSKKSMLQKVNGIVHPEVKKDFQEWCLRQKKDIVFMESAILFESGFETEVDQVWFVSAPERLRIERAMKRDGSTLEMVESRIKAQWREEKKMERSDAVIQNDENHSLIVQVQTLLSAILNNTK